VVAFKSFKDDSWKKYQMDLKTEQNIVYRISEEIVVNIKRFLISATVSSIIAFISEFGEFD
jgi:hypothetical protein